LLFGLIAGASAATPDGDGQHRHNYQKNRGQDKEHQPPDTRDMVSLRAGRIER
jgi:hypothetical protein